MFKKGGQFGRMKAVSVGDGSKAQGSVEGAFDAELFDGDIVTDCRKVVEVSQEVVGDKEDGDVLLDHFRGLGPQSVHTHGGLEVAEGYFDIPSSGVEGGELMSGIGLGICERGEQMEGLAFALAVAAFEADLAQREGVLKAMPSVLVEIVSILRFVQFNKAVAAARLSFDRLECAQHLIFNAHEDVGLLVEDGVNKSKVLVVAVSDQDIAGSQFLKQIDNGPGEFAGAVVSDGGLDQGGGIKIEETGNANQREAATGLGLRGLGKGKLIGGGVGGGHCGGIDQSDASAGEAGNLALMGVKVASQAIVGSLYQVLLETLSSLAQGRSRATTTAFPAFVLEHLDVAQSVPQGTLRGPVSEDLPHIGPEGSTLAIEAFAFAEGVQHPSRNDRFKEAFQLTETTLASSLYAVLQSCYLILSAAAANTMPEPR